ncbi:MAG: DUF3450 family protein [Marinicella sp.]
MKQTLKTSLLISALGCVLVSQMAWSQQDSEAIVNNLIALRGQVEDLQAELQILKAEHTQSMTYLNTRKTELEANIDRKQLQIKQSQAEVVELQEKIKTLGLDSEQMIPDVLTLAKDIEQAITTGIPFKPTERKAVIESIVRDLEGRKITSQHAINRLWAFLEDEMRLARENAIYSQTIELNGEQVLVDVAKLGTVLMYFKTRDDRYGQAINDRGWQFKLFDEEKDSQAVALLFDSLKKQIRQGYFTLPLNLKNQG